MQQLLLKGCFCKKKNTTERKWLSKQITTIWQFTNPFLSVLSPLCRYVQQYTSVHVCIISGLILWLIACTGFGCVEIEPPCFHTAVTKSHYNSFCPKGDFILFDRPVILPSLPSCVNQYYDCVTTIISKVTTLECVHMLACDLTLIMLDVWCRKCSQLQQNQRHWEILGVMHYIWIEISLD